MTLANLNPITGNGVFVTQYLRRLTERVDVGAEFVYQKDPRLQGFFLFSFLFKNLINLKEAKSVPFLMLSAT